MMKGYEYRNPGRCQLCEEYVTSGLDCPVCDKQADTTARGDNAVMPSQEDEIERERVEEQRG